MSKKRYNDIEARKEHTDKIKKQLENMSVQEYINKISKQNQEFENSLRNNFVPVISLTKKEFEKQVRESLLRGRKA